MVRIFPVNNDMSSFQGSAQRRQLISNKQLPPRRAASLLREGVSAGRQGRRRGRSSKTWIVSSSRLQGPGTEAWRVSRPWWPPALPVPMESHCGVLLAGLLAAPGHTQEEDQPASVCAGHMSSTCTRRTKDLMRLEPQIPTPRSPGGPPGQPQCPPPSRFILPFFSFHVYISGIHRMWSFVPGFSP